MTQGGAAPLPGTGDEILMVRVAGGPAATATARVLYGRGKGLLVELEPGAAKPRKGDRGFVLFDAADSSWSFRAVVGEVLSPTRCYVLPVGDPVRMEKREYIRADLSLPAALDLDPGDGPAVEPPLVERTVDLSASGLNWPETFPAPVGARVRVWLRLPSEPARTLAVTAEVVRTAAGGLACHFLDLAPEDRLALAALVFRARITELGLDDAQDL